MGLFLGKKEKRNGKKEIRTTKQETFTVHTFSTLLAS